jgi:hypothetical protein
VEFLGYLEFTEKKNILALQTMHKHKEIKDWGLTDRICTVGQQSRFSLFPFLPLYCM